MAVDNQDPEKLFEMLFLQMVMSLNEAAMIQMGKMVNPSTGKVEKNIAQAQGTIDLLRMLKSHTKNNLIDQEEQLLEQCLVNLEMNFVYEKEERDKADAKTVSKEKSEEITEPDETTDPQEEDEDSDRNDSPGSRPGMNN
jgi:uncharacterized protein DUF1844